jgi:hypothetical protein
MILSGSDRSFFRYFAPKMKQPWGKRGACNLEEQKDKSFNR